MSFSSEWNTAYDNGQRMSISGIPSVLSSLLINFIGSLKGQRVLEFGCGTGNNARFIVEEGGEYFGIDGSESAIKFAMEKNPKSTFACCDFTEGHPFGDDFDLVIDRASISHNDTDGIKRAISLIWQSLKPGGLFVSADWFSDNHSESGRGEFVDERTRTGYTDGQFVAVGRVHFSNEQELAGLFSMFDRGALVERITRYLQGGLFFKDRISYPWISKDFDWKEYSSAVFDIVVRKTI